MNKIKDIREINPGMQRLFEVTIKDAETDEVLYQETSGAGVVCTMESVKPIVACEVGGVHQILGWGNILVQGHAIMMLRDNMIKNMDSYIDEAEKAGMIFSDKEGFKRFLRRKID